MRVGIKVLRNGRAAEGASPAQMLPLTTGFPLIPACPRTDVNGEWFGLVPLAISPAIYLMDVVVDPGGSAIRISGGFDEIETQLFVDLNRRNVERKKLGDRIPRAYLWSWPLVSKGIPSLTGRANLTMAASSALGVVACS